jgi:hypothetical protein
MPVVVVVVHIIVAVVELLDQAVLEVVEMGLRQEMEQLDRLIPGEAVEVEQLRLMVGLVDLVL